MLLKSQAELAIERERLCKERKSVQIRILVGLSSCGIAAGAKEVLKRFEEIVSKRSDPTIIVEQTGCVGYCYTEPTVEIIKANGRKLLLGPVFESDVQNVFDMHVANDLAESKYVLPCNFRSCFDEERN